MQRSYPLHPPPRSRPTAARAFAVAILAGVGIAALIPAPGLAGPVPQDIAVLLLSDGFEGSFPGTNWTVRDNEPLGANDYWASSTYRTFAGNTSVWSAGVGSQAFPATVESQGFESGLGSWQVDSDNVGGSGVDDWGVSTWRANSGSSSLWCAQVGSHTNGTSNSAFHMHDDNADTTVLLDVDLSNYSAMTLSYRYFLDAEAGYDYFYAGYYNGGWTWVTTYNGRQAGLGFQYDSITVPSTASSVGFRWFADQFTTYEGVYLDDITLSGTRNDANTALRTYDTDMNATMVKPVSASQYGFTRVDFRYWLEVDSPNDSLSFSYLSGGNWTNATRYNVSTVGWQAASVAIPANATLISFRFSSDGVGHAEGAYLDEVKVYGVALPPTCSANVSALSGTEVLTAFSYTASVSDGLRPYAWSWSFTDGTSSTLQNPAHAYGDVGTYNGAVTVTDSLGQTCRATSPDVTVAHDTTGVSVGPPVKTVVEGASFTVSGFDGQGHPYPLDWALLPPECGALDLATGPAVTFTAATTAGGSFCTVTGSLGGASASTAISVLHDTSEVAVSPASAAVPEGTTLALFANDHYGHSLDFTWAVSCGRVTPGTGPSTVFTAVATGGAVCTATATWGSDSGSAVIDVTHDTSTITITPASANLVEGREVALSAVDRYTHPFNATWTVVPVSCGSFSEATGTSTRFAAGVDAGGLVCTVSATQGADAKDVTVTVAHDLSTISLTPSSVTLVEGADQPFSAADAFGHPFVVSWSLTPFTCGVASPASPSAGPSTTVSISATAGGSACTLSATSGTVSLLASIAVTHGSAASVRLTPSATEVEAGASLTFTAAVLDGANHTLADLAISWATSCGVLSSPTGGSNSLALPNDAAGATCTVTATHATLSASTSIAVLFATPFTVTVTASSPSTSGGASQTLTAKVLDAHGLEVPNATVTWTASCGVLSSTSGKTVTFTAPSDLGGSTCSVSAATDSGGAVAQSAATVTASTSFILPLIAIVAVAGATLAFLMWRRKQKRRATAEGASASPETPPEPAPVIVPVDETPPGKP